MGIEQSRRDDLESICYILVYFLKGSLPWQGLRGKSKNEKYQAILDAKLSTAIETLCKGLPAELQVLLKYCRALKFEEEPDYEALLKPLKQLFTSSNYAYDYVFDWTIQAENNEKKSAYNHLLVKQKQLTRGSSARHLKDIPKAEEEIPKKVPNRFSSSKQLPFLKPVPQEEASMAVNCTYLAQPDGSVRRISEEVPPTPRKEEKVYFCIKRYKK